MDPTGLSATQLASAIRERQLSSREALDAVLARIERRNPALNAVIHLDPDHAYRAATRADRAIALGQPVGRLHGVPVLLKDSHRIAGMPTIVGDSDAPATLASSDGHVAARMRGAGALLLGKTNTAPRLADFQTDNPVFGRSNNPWSVDHTPGGSSGGAAAAVAARMTPLEIGSDIAGSIRIPAHFCGVLGLKPTPTLVPRRGHIAEPRVHPRGGGSAALATIGPIARDFDDLELALDIIAVRRDWRRGRPGGGIPRLGVIPAFPGLRVQRSVVDAAESIANLAAEQGAAVEIADPPLDPVIQQEAWVAVHRAASRRGVRWRGGRAARLQASAMAAWDRVFERFDAILCPPAMCVAFTHRPTGTPIEIDGTPIPYWGLARYTTPFNLTEHPALVIPVAMDAARLPIGVQVVASRGSDQALIGYGRWLASLATPLPDPDA